MRVIKTPLLPILNVFEQSENLFINITTTTTISVTITANPDVQFVPSNVLEITPQNGYVSFYVLPLSSNIFTMEYDIVSSSDNFQKPEDDYLVVYSDATSNYFELNGLEPGVVGPGCCSRDTFFRNSYCAATNREVLVSSSCGWDNTDEAIYRTKGLSLIHSGGISLPLSLSTLNANLSSSGLDISVSNEADACSQCTDNVTEGTCYDWDLTITDTREMVQSESLLNTLISSMASGLPGNLTVATTQRSKRLQAYDHTAALMDASYLYELSGCENLPQPQEGLMYAVRSHTNLNIGIDADRVALENDPNWKPMCFAVSLCELPQTPLYISLPIETRDVISGFQFFQPYVQAGWTITSRSTGLSSYGIGTFSKEWFWNGTHRFPLDVPYYDVMLWMSADGSIARNNHALDFSFTGYFYSIIGHNIKVCMCKRIQANINFLIFLHRSPRDLMENAQFLSLHILMTKLG